jgi:hypothetical protein
VLHEVGIDGHGTGEEALFEETTDGNGKGALEPGSHEFQRNCCGQAEAPGDDPARIEPATESTFADGSPGEQGECCLEGMDGQQGNEIADDGSLAELSAKGKTGRDGTVEDVAEGFGGGACIGEACDFRG